MPIRDETNRVIEETQQRASLLPPPADEVNIWIEAFKKTTDILATKLDEVAP